MSVSDSFEFRLEAIREAQITKYDKKCFVRHCYNDSSPQQIISMTCFCGHIMAEHTFAHPHPCKTAGLLGSCSCVKYGATPERIAILVKKLDEILDE